MLESKKRQQTKSVLDLLRSQGMPASPVPGGLEESPEDEEIDMSGRTVRSPLSIPGLSTSSVVEQKKRKKRSGQLELPPEEDEES